MSQCNLDRIFQPRRVAVMGERAYCACQCEARHQHRHGHPSVLVWWVEA